MMEKDCMHKSAEPSTQFAGFASTPRGVRRMDIPLRFEPFLRPMVWGSRELEKQLGKRLPNGGPYGESWEISDHPIHRSVVADGPYAGLSLRVLMQEQSGRLLGTTAEQYTAFPWLFKFLDACDQLSVQVHPDEKSVAKLWPGEQSKTEAWVVIAAHPGSRIYAGLKPGINEFRLREALKTSSVVDCLHGFEPRPGDCVFLPAGTVHAVGGGVLIAEIQQTSDATFRLYDWDRRDRHGNTRQLHVEEAMASIHWDQGPVHPVRCDGFPGGKEPVPPVRRYRQKLVSCPYFHVEYIRASEPFVIGGDNRLEVMAILNGSGQFTSAAEDRTKAGDVWLLPAALPRLWCRPEGTIHALHCILP
jgi:mannose-6-phosphate isomerase